MNKISFKHQIDKETLAGLIIQTNKEIVPSCVFLHGGGLPSYKERIFDFAEPILQKNINILSFDFSGHGEITGILNQGSLYKRVNEAKEITQNDKYLKLTA